MCEGMGDLFGGGSMGFGSNAGGGAGAASPSAAASDPVPTPTPATPPTPGGDEAGGFGQGAAPAATPPVAPTPSAAAGAVPVTPPPAPAGPAPGGAPGAQNPQHDFGHFMQGLLRQLLGPQAGGMPGSGLSPIGGNGAFSNFFNGMARRQQPGGGAPGAPGAGGGGDAPAAPAAGLPPVTTPKPMPPTGSMPINSQGQSPFAGLFKMLSGYGLGG